MYADRLEGRSLSVLLATVFGASRSVCFAVEIGFAQLSRVVRQRFEHRLQLRQSAALGIGERRLEPRIDRHGILSVRLKADATNGTNQVKADATNDTNPGESGRYE